MTRRAQGRGRLVHQAGRCADEGVLGPPGQPGPVHRLDVEIVEVGECGQHGALQRGRGGQARPDRYVRGEHQVRAADLVARLAAAPRPPRRRRRAQPVMPGCRSRTPNDCGPSLLSDVTRPGAVAPRRGGDRHPLGERERHHEAVVVVGVLADQVDPAGRGPDSGGWLAGPVGEGRGDDVGIGHGSYSTSVLAACRRRCRPDGSAATRCRSGRSSRRAVPDGWVERRGQGGRAEPPRRLVAARRRPAGRPAADDLGLRRGGGAAGRPRGDRVRGGQRSGFRRDRRDLRPAALAAVGALPGHVRRAPVRVPAGQPGRQARRAQLRRGGLPADRLADRVPDALHRLGRPARATPSWSREPAGEWPPPWSCSARHAGLRVWVTSRDEAARRASRRPGCRPGLRLRRRGCRSGSMR